MTMQPPTLPLWIAVLLLPLRQGWQPYRVLGWIFVILFALFLIQNARFYFLPRLIRCFSPRVRP